MVLNRSRHLYVVTALVGTAAVLAPAAPALAHDRLVSTTPAAGAALQRLPATMRLNFSEKVLPVGTEVVVKDASGTNVATSSSVSGSEVTTRLSPGRAGQHQVAWRVVSQDGHPISGSFSFTTAQGAPSASPTTSAASATAPTSAASAEPSVSGSSDNGAGASKVVIFGLPILAMIGIVFFAGRRRNQR